MDLLLVLLLFLTPQLGSASRALKIYTNTWAVHISGGVEEADRLARKHGFINHGNVFGDYYHFQHRAVVKRSLSSHRGVHVRLHKEPQVLWAEQQVAKRRKKRDIYTVEPSDPEFSQQWYLVEKITFKCNQWG